MQIHVETYSGYKADERPVRFVKDGKSLAVTEILRQWREPTEACYRVRASDGGTFTLRRHLHAKGGEFWEITADRNG